MHTLDQSLRRWRWWAVALAAWAIPIWLTSGTLSDYVYLIGVWGAAGLGLVAARKHTGLYHQALREISIGVACFAVGDLLWTLAGWWAPQLLSTGLIDLVYLAGYPFIAIGCLRIVRRLQPAGRLDRADVYDTIIVGLGATVISWPTLIIPAFSGGSGFGGRLAAVSYPICDIMLLTLCVLAVLAAAWHPALRLLMAGMALVLAADIVFAVGSRGSASWSPTWLDVMWYASDAAIALAILWPKRAGTPKPSGNGLARTAVLSAAMAAAPAVWFLKTIPQNSNDTILAVLITLLIVAVIGRLGITLRQSNRAEDRLRFAATHDPLTGLANRTLLDENIKQTIDRVRRFGGYTLVAFLDLDHFKVINDSLGHALGDKLLISVAAKLQEAVRDVDCVARLGGDEFVICCEHHDENANHQLADRLMHILSEPIRIDGRELSCTTSIGVAVDSTGTSDPATMMRNADLALYLAKERGRGRVEHYDDSLHSNAVRRLGVEDSLRQSLRDGSLKVLGQPVVDMHSGTTGSIEFLVQLEHVDTDMLIEVAEETGLICQLGAYVRHAGLAYLARSGLRGAINLSGRELGEINAADNLLADIVTAGCTPDQVDFELTERTLLLDNVAVHRNLDQLRAAGCGLLVDDFGTGYSALAYLKRFPVTGIKIDRSFIAGLPDDGPDRAIVKAVIAVAGAFDLAVISEGVEHDAQRLALLELGCTYGQGYLWCHPCTLDELDTYVHTAAPTPGSA